MKKGRRRGDIKGNNKIERRKRKKNSERKDRLSIGRELLLIFFLRKVQYLIDNLSQTKNLKIHKVL